MAEKIVKPAPVIHRVDDAKLGITKPWREYFDETTKEVGYSLRRKFNTLSYTGSCTLDDTSFGKIIKVTCNVESTITLPTVTSTLVDSWVTILRIGTAVIRIQAPSGTSIGNSGVGGAVICSELDRKDANLQLVAATTALYVILSGTGIWKVVGKSFV